jgi:hypothetical protein
MANTTPLYGFPYLELGDPPDLASGTEDLATAVETKISAMTTTPTQVLFTANGTYTKPANLKAVWVRVIGGGGAGGASGTTGVGTGSAGAGGGGGEYAEAIIPAATLAATVAVTCGAAGAVSAGAGGASSFGAHVIANGGSGGATCGVASGVVAAGGAGGTGGAGSFGTIFRRNGQAGDMGRVQGGEPIPSRGGNSGLAYGAGAQQASSINAVAGQGGQPFGGGGGGGTCRPSQSAQNGGAGATGGVIVVNLF